MKTLEEEAREYASKIRTGVEFDSVEDALTYEECAREDFIAGANSKWVQVEKIRAQIEIAEIINKKFDVSEEIEFLKQRLNELEYQEHLEKNKKDWESALAELSEDRERRRKQKMLKTENGEESKIG